VKPKPAKPLQLIITVHGIRTHGFWQERLERLLFARKRPFETHFINYKFGYFSAISFLIPIARNLVARRFRNEFIRLCAAYSYSRIDLVGHSFGTFVIAKAIATLTKEQSFAVDTVILSGSVLSSSFPWHKYIGTRIQRVVNDCGSRDAILLLSNYFVFSTGMAGRTGFSGSTSSALRNRFSSFGHSGYFQGLNGKPSDNYMRRYWLPLLTNNGPALGFDFREPPTSFDAFTEGLATHSGRIKLAVYLTPLIVTSAIFYRLWINADTQRHLKEQVAERAAYTTSDFIYKTFGNSAGEIEMRPSFKQILLDQAHSALDGLDGISKIIEPVRQRGLAAVLIEQSTLNTDRDSSSAGVSTAESAIEILSGLRSTRPLDTEIQFDLATAYDRLAAAYLKNEERAAAVNALNKGSELLQHLAGRNPLTEKLLKNIAANKEKLGSILVASQSLGLARVAFSESCKLRSNLTALFAGRPDLQLDLMRCHLEVGQVLRSQGKPEDALTELQAILSIGKRIPASVDALLFLARAHLRLGELHEIPGSSSEAAQSDLEDHYRKAFNIIKSIIAVQSGRLDVAASYAEATLNMGYLLASTKRNSEAMSLYHDYMRYIREDRSTSNELSRLNARVKVAIGDVEREAGNLDLARADYSEAITDLEKLRWAHLASSLWRPDLLSAYRRASDISFAICDTSPPNSRGICMEGDAWQIANRRSELMSLAPVLSEDLREAYADILSDEAWHAIFAGEYDRAVVASEQAMGLLSKPVPDTLNWIVINYAHALMFDQRLDEAREIYRKNWENTNAREMIRKDFKTLRSHRKCQNLMTEVAPEFATCGTLTEANQ
jgi:tetratricopeptide (TPR) repeat protein